MDTQKTLNSFIKSRKRPINDDNLHKEELVNNTFGINKPIRKLSFDCTVQQTIKKLKVDSGITQTSLLYNFNKNDTGINNNVTEKNLEKKETDNKNEVNLERATTPNQSPSTKEKLRKELDLGEFHKIVNHKHNRKKLQEKIHLVQQSQIDLKSAESKVVAAKSQCSKLADLLDDTIQVTVGPTSIKQSQLKPTVLFLSPTQRMVTSKKAMTMTQSKEYVSPRKLLDGVESFFAMLPSKRYGTLVDSKTFPLPLKYRILEELFKAMETVLFLMFTRKDKITFNNLKRVVQDMTKKNFTELHLAQIKTVVPDFFKFTLVKSPKDICSFELVIAPNYENNDKIDLIELTTQREKIFSNALLDIMKDHHKEYLNKLIPPIMIDKDSMTRWHPEFDVETVKDIVPSTLPKIKIIKPIIATAKDLMNKSYALLAYNNRLKKTHTTINDENKNLTDKKFPTTDAKNSLKEALKRIPKSLLFKIQEKQAQKAKKLMTKSKELELDRMMNRLPGIARSMRTYFAQLQKNIMPFKKVVEKLNQSYPTSMTEGQWKSYVHLLQKKVPCWIVSIVLDGIEYIQINKEVEFEETVIKTLKK